MVELAEKLGFRKWKFKAIKPKMTVRVKLSKNISCLKINIGIWEVAPKRRLNEITLYIYKQILFLQFY